VVEPNVSKTKVPLRGAVKRYASSGELRPVPQLALNVSSLKSVDPVFV
jgi:hypothetical protein